MWTDGYVNEWPEVTASVATPIQAVSEYHQTGSVRT